MNVRLTILLAVLAVMIGATWAIIEFTDLVYRGDPDPDEPWLFHIEPSDITRIEVAHKEDSIEFARDAASNQWMIIGDPSYPVFSYRWGGIPLLLSGPRVNRGLKETIDDGSQYGLDPPESVVRVSDFSGNTFEFHMGIPTPDGDNQYARLVGDHALYTVPSIWAQVINRLAFEPPWGRLFDLEIIQITVVEITAGDETTVYFLDNESWFVHSGPPPVDEAKAAPVSVEWADWLEILTSPRVDTIVDARLGDRETERLEEYGFLPPAVRVVFARRGETTIEIHLAEGPPGSDSYYARTINNVDETLYSIKKSRLEGIETLVTDPLISPDWEPPDEAMETEDEETEQGESSN
jgi:hypothetical protein